MSFGNKVNIDWSCCDEDIQKAINQKIFKRTGIKTEGIIVGNDDMIQVLGEILLEISKEKKKTNTDVKKIGEKR
jgi:hypothetical protein